MTDASSRPPLPPDEARVTHLRASVLRGMQLTAESLDGAGGWGRLLDALPPDSGDAFRAGLDSFRWIETGHVNRLALAHEARFGADSVTERARAAVREQLQGSHPALLGLLGPADVMHQTPTIYRFYYRGGHVSVDRVSAGRALISVWAEGLYPTWYSVSCPTWLCGAVSLAGASDPAFRHLPPTTGSRHRYELTWKDA